MKGLRALTNKLINRAEMNAERERLWSKPVVVDVVLTKACNFACTFCKDYETEGAKRISLTNFEKMAAQLMPTASQMSICSGGEPYLHTGLEEILRTARRYNPKIYNWVLSNGSILKEERLARIIDGELITEHGFSVDGFKAATVEGIRLNAKLPVILDNIRMLLRLRAESRKRHPTVTIRYALMRSNIEELPDAVRFWGDLGIEKINTGYLSLANGMDHDLSLYYHQELAKKYFDLARQAAESFPHLQLNLPETISDQERYKTSPQKCRAPWEFVMIDTDGVVLPCYRAFEALRFDSLYDEHGANFDDIWNSDRYLSLRRTVNADDKKKFYEYCGRCEARYGWSEERAHLGDESWFDALGDKWLTHPVSHKRPLKGAAARASGPDTADE